MTATLTDMQRTVLLAFPGGASAEGDNGASWTEVADLATATGLTKRQVMGVLSALGTKGLIYADEEKANGEKGTLQCLTDEGARLVGILSDTPEDTALVMAEVEAEVAAAAAEGGAETDPTPAPAAPSSWDACETAAQVKTFATSQGMALAQIDPMEIVAKFPSPHFNLKSLGTFHWRRFPKHTPREGVFVALTRGFGAVVVRDGVVEGPAGHKPVRIVTLWRAE